MFSPSLGVHLSLAKIIRVKLLWSAELNSAPSETQDTLCSPSMLSFVQPRPPELTQECPPDLATPEFHLACSLKSHRAVRTGR